MSVASPVKYDELNIAKRGRVFLNYTADVEGQLDTEVVEHNLGYVPFVEASYINLGNIYVPDLPTLQSIRMPHEQFTDDGGVGLQFAVSYVVDSKNITFFRLQGPNTGASDPAVLGIKWYAFSQEGVAGAASTPEYFAPWDSFDLYWDDTDALWDDTSTV